MNIPEEIIKGCRKGRGDSQKRLYDLTSPVMYGICLQYAGNRDDAKDFMQEGYIKVFKKINQFSGKGSVMGWIRRIMINTALEKLRKQVRIVSLEEEAGNHEEMIENSIIGELTAEEILSLVQGLSPGYRMVFNLYAIEGYSHKEISNLTGISEGTSKSNLSRARSILQRRIKEFYLEKEKPGDEGK